MSHYFKLFPTVTIIPFYLCTIQQRITNTLTKNKNNFLIYFYFINCSYFHLLKSWLVIEYSAKTPGVFGFYNIILHHNDVIVLLFTERSVVNVFINKLKQFTTIPINVL